MNEKEIESADKFMLCENNVGFFCKVINHAICNGVASQSHCNDCKYFKLKEKQLFTMANLFFKKD
jgi:hypothetical protein